MASDYSEEPEEDDEPDEVVVHRWEVAQRLISELGLQESESNLHSICHEITNILEAYEEARFCYVDERFANASKELKKVSMAAEKLRISLAQLGDGARFALNSNKRSPREKQAWEKAGGENLPKVIGPAPDESRFTLHKESEDIWKEDNPKFIFGPLGYMPSPLELQLKRLEEWIDIKVSALRRVGELHKPKRMGDVINGGSPRHKMIGMCTILLGSHGQDLSTNLLPLIRMIEEEVNPGTAVKWDGTEAAMRARWWWVEVGPYFGKPNEEIPPDKQALLKQGWVSISRYKKK